MIPILTSIIGLVAKGPNAKGIAGGIAGLLISATGPALDSFQRGFGVGVGNSVEELGVAVGQLLASFITGYVITWLSPTNGGD